MYEKLTEQFCSVSFPPFGDEFGGGSAVALPSFFGDKNHPKSPQKLSTVDPIFPPTNKRSKNGENPVKSRVCGSFSVEKTVENVKS
ncbi:MAG: hypothetical protein IKL13_04900 [Clostridia bacterium]|nr:hypothetical protein [Clostridia bacterium]